MKKIYYRFLAILLCLTISSFCIFNSLNVRSYADVYIDGGIIGTAGDIANWLYDNFTDTVSGIAGFIYSDGIEPVWNGWLNVLGIHTSEDLDSYCEDNIFFDGSSSGGNVHFSDNFVNGLRDYINDYNNDLENYGYIYSWNLNQYRNYFQNQAYFDAIKNLLSQNRGKLILISYIDKFSQYENPTLQNLGANCPRIYIFDTTSYTYGGSLITNNKVRNGFGKRTSAGNSPTWNNSVDILVYTFDHNGDTSLTQHTGGEYVYTEQINYCLALNKGEYISDSTLIDVGSASYMARFITYPSQVSFPWFSSASDGDNYRLTNLMPYYQVPINPNLVSSGGNYTISTSNLDNSISYGDISDYVNSNNVSSYEITYNYINNYYGSSSGGSGGSGGSGSDIDWSWLGRIGEIIGGLISALGNVIAGIIDGISSLITSLTESLPNIFSSILEWLLPFIPSEVISLLSLLFMAIIIVGVVRLIRGK